MPQMEVWQMLSSAKKILNVVLLVLLIVGIYQGINYIQNKNNGNNTITVEQNKNLKKLSKEDELYIPKNAKAIGKIDIKNRSEDPSKIKKETVIIHTDASCNTCLPKYTHVIKTEAFYGLTNEPKFFIGILQDNISIGYAHSFIRLNKFTIDAIAGMPAIGLGGGYQLTNNSFIGLGATAKYLNYESITNLSSYNISIEIPLTIRPMGYMGFRF